MTFSLLLLQHSIRIWYIPNQSPIHWYIQLCCNIRFSFWSAVSFHTPSMISLQCYVKFFFLLNSASNMFTVCNTCYVWKKWQILKTKLKRIKASIRKISGWSVFISIFEIFYCGKLHWNEQNKNEQNIKEQNTKWLNVRDRRIHSVAKMKAFAIFDVHIFHGNTSDRLWLPWFER